MLDKSGFKWIAITNSKLVKIPLDEYLREAFNKLKNGEDPGNSGLPLPDMLVLREPDMAHHEYALLAERIREICAPLGVELILHSHADLAEKLHPSGLHLPFSEFCALHPAREIFAKNSGYHPEFCGTSVHSAEDLVYAIECGADYVFAGHIYETDCKKNLPPRGESFLKHIISLKPADFPVYAVGGINLENSEKIRAAGANGACLMSAYMTLAI